MTCDEALRLIELLSDGEASASQREAVASHLAGCDSCRDHEVFLRDVDQAAAGGLPADPPRAYWEHFPSKVMARLDDEAPPAGRTRGWLDRWFTPSVWRFASAAAAVTLVVFLGTFVVRDPEVSEEVLRVGTPASPASQPSSTPSTSPAPSAPSSPEPTTPTSPTSEPPPVVEAESVAPPPAVGEASPPPDIAVESEAPPTARDEALEPPPAETEEAPVGPVAGRRARAFAQEASPARSQIEAQQSRRAGNAVVADAREALDCDAARAAIDRGVSGEPLKGARYVAARCSIDAHAARPDAATRARAVTDAEAFLALESEGERAREIQQLVASMPQ